MSTEATIKCPVPPIDPVWRDVCDQPSPEHFTWGEEKVGIPRQLIHQLHRYDHSYPTGSYVGKMFLQGNMLVWMKAHSRNSGMITNDYVIYEEIGEHITSESHPLEPCPLCGEEAYCGFHAKNHGDRVAFSITCGNCGLTFGNEYKIGLPLSIANSMLVLGLWNDRRPPETWGNVI